MRQWLRNLLKRSTRRIWARRSQNRGCRKGSKQKGIAAGGKRNVAPPAAWPPRSRSPRIDRMAAINMDHISDGILRSVRIRLRTPGFSLGISVPARNGLLCRWIFGFWRSLVALPRLGAARAARIGARDRIASGGPCGCAVEFGLIFCHYRPTG